MKIFPLITMCLLLVSCEKDTIQSQLDNAVVLKGILVAGDNHATIELGKLQSVGDHGVEQPVQGASVFIAGGSQETNLGELAGTPGLYSSPVDEIVILYGDEYEVNVVVSDRELSATATIPFPIQFLSISDQIVLVDETNPGQLVFECSWEEEEGFEYVFVLDEPGGEPMMIDFGVPAGNFSSIHQLPTEKTVLRIYDTDFKLYGEHELHIYKIDAAYSNLFRYTPGLNHNAFNAPDNVIGGSGYLTGVSRVSLDLIVQEP